MLFSATMPTEILKLVDSILKSPVKITVTPVSSTIDTIKQGLYFVEKRNKKALLIHILKDKSIDSVLVFSRTKHGANKITQDLEKVGIEAQAIHGNKSQNARQLALNNFKEKKIRVLVATDIAARGIDVDELSLVINYDLPDTPETYVHRIGRTGRAGAEGVALTFCDEEERESLRDIEKLISKSIPVIEEHPYPMSASSIVQSKVVKKEASPNKGRRTNYNRRGENKYSGKQQSKQSRN
jgi:ATP-dependent RNA helicase RhlE